jgi:hypothetical protein
MALVRQKEIEWTFAQPPAPFPKCPGANGCFLSPSGGGKTTTLVSMLLGPYKAIYAEIHVFSPSVFIDSAWDVVVKHAKTLDTEEFKSSFHDDWDEPALLGIMAKQRKRIQELKLNKSKKALPQIICILDDLADTGVMHQATNALATCFIRGRHLGVSTWLSVQKLSTIHPVARTNFAFILCWELRNKKELFGGVLYELSNIHSTDTLFEIYKMATEDPHSFLCVNLKAKPVEFWVRFEEKLVID